MATQKTTHEDGTQANPLKQIGILQKNTKISKIRASCGELVLFMCCARLVDPYTSIPPYLGTFFASAFFIKKNRSRNPAKYGGTRNPPKHQQQRSFVCKTIIRGNSAVLPHPQKASYGLQLRLYNQPKINKTGPMGPHTCK